MIFRSFSPNQFKTKERLISHIRDLNVVNDKSEITILGTGMVVY